MKKQSEPKVHYTEGYLIAPVHPVTVTLVGCGGTGSQMLNNLARIHMALLALGHPGFHVTVMDDDEVTTANLGRQLFSPSELGLNKASALVTRVNRFFGLQWQAAQCKLDLKVHKLFGNILITAVDNVAIRKDIGQLYEIGPRNIGNRPEVHNYYWMDLGNSKSTGQVIMGSNGKIKQPAKSKGTVATLKSVTDIYPNLEKFEKADDTPSCSLAEALTKQDLFINSTLAQLGANIIWKMFRELKIKYNGVYLNLETFTTNPIKI